VISGSDVKVYLFGPSTDFVISEAYVNNDPATVSFDQKGYFLIVRQEGQFHFSADMDLRQIGQLQLHVPGPINALLFDLEHGYAVSGDQYGIYNKNVMIQRSEKTAMLIDASYRFTYADRNQFYYLINFKSFGSSLGAYTVNLPNGEQVLDVTGVLKWEQRGTSLVLELEGSQATVSVIGTFNSKYLSTPLNEGLQHVTIESDAEKKITISTTAKEIDISESPLPYNFPNARAFLAREYDKFTVTVKQLDLLPSLSASVRSANNQVAITDKGSVVGELTYRYANTGVDYIEIDAPGQPLYASTQSGPVKLTKDDKFLLAFPKTQRGNLDMVYFETIDKPKFVDFIDVPLAKTDLPITEQTTQIYLPKNFFVVNVIGAVGGSDMPGFKSLVLFILIVGGLALWLLKDVKFIIRYLVFASGLMLFDYRLFLLLLAVTVFFIVKRYLVGKTWWKWALAGAGVLFAVGIVISVGIMFLGSMSSMDRLSENMVGADYADMEESYAPQMKGMQIIGEDDGAISVPLKTGVLPVKLELPRLGKQITVKNHLVTVENPVELKLFIVKSWVIYIYYLIALLAGLGAYRKWKT